MTAQLSNQADSLVRPLEGTTIVACEHAVAAPFATRQLADLGARVIKIERQGVGDFARRYDEAVLGQSSHFVWLNRGKESIELDLKSEEGRQILGQLVADADVFIQNLAPGAAERLGFGAEALTERHPSLVYCSISGYGSNGPMSHYKAYDLLVQAEVGLVSITGSPDEGAKAGIPVADIGAGMYAFSGILAALLRRNKTNKGTAFEVSLFDALAEWMSFPLYFSRYGTTPMNRSGASHATIAPYGPFETCDGPPVVLAIQNEREWKSFCINVVQDPELALDETFESNSARLVNRVELHRRIDLAFAVLPRAEIVERLHEAAIGFADLNDVPHLVSHPQLAERGRWREIDTPEGRIEAILPPFAIGPEPVMGPVPALGEHTESILRSLGYADTEITDLTRRGVI